MLEKISQLGVGGAGMQGQEPGSAAAAIKELQGLSIELLAGAAANTKIAVAAIRPEDTILKAINNNAGTLTDITANVSIDDPRAVGTITLSGAAAGQTVTVAGVTYTAVAGVAANSSQFSVAGDDTADATALAAAINASENGRDTQQVTATSAAGVVTVKAVADGTSGNAITLVKVGAGITVSGATLAGGTATGGIRSTGITNQIILHWFNKK
jgi:phage tail sheath gpL-like